MIFSMTFAGLPDSANCARKISFSFSSASAGDLVAADELGVRGRHLHRQFLDERLEVLGLGHEVRLAIHLHQHAQLGEAERAGALGDRHVHVGAHRARLGGAAGPLGGLREPALAEDVIASSWLPLASVRAALHSIIPAPVFSRSAFTCSAVIAIAMVVLRVRKKAGRKEPWPAKDSEGRGLGGIGTLLPPRKGSRYPLFPIPCRI